MNSSNSAVNNTPSLQSAGVFRRIGAMVYDAFLLLGVLFVATAILGAISGGFNGGQSIEDGDVVNELPLVMEGLFFQVYLAVVVTLFYGFFWVKNGQTLGMQAWRIHVEKADGQPIDWPSALLRVISAAPSILLAGAGYWWLWLDRDKLTWHDRLSKTRVLYTPKK